MEVLRCCISVLQGHSDLHALMTMKAVFFPLALHDGQHHQVPDVNPLMGWQTTSTADNVLAQSPVPYPGPSTATHDRCVSPPSHTMTLERAKNEQLQPFYGACQVGLEEHQHGEVT
jgi:hypothetical protein